MIWLLVPYILIGLFISRTLAVYFTGKYRSWNDNHLTTAVVILAPFLWIVLPLLLPVGYAIKKADELATWTGKELSNAKENV